MMHCRWHLPNISSDTGMRKISPVNSQVVCFASIPDVPSKTFEENTNRTNYVLPQSHPQSIKIQQHVVFDFVGFRELSSKLIRDHALHGIRHTTLVRVQQFGSWVSTWFLDFVRVKKQATYTKINKSVVPTINSVWVITWTTAFDPLTSSTWPLLFVPSARVKLTISANLGNCLIK